MKIKMSLFGYGSEYRAGYIPEKIWKYIQDECEGDASVYNEKLDDGEIPDELKLAESSGEYYDAASFFEGYLPYSDTSLNIKAEDDTDLGDINLEDFKTKELFESKLNNSKPYFVWESVEKGCWDVVNEDDDELIEIGEEFDVTKLKIHLEKLKYDNNSKELAFISAIEYDGEIYNITLNSTTGKYFGCDFYKDSEED
jgi:hypothetical protein